MNLRLLLEKNPPYTTWQKFYHNESSWGHYIPSPATWSHIQEDLDNFTPETWVSWYTNPHLKELLPDLSVMFDDTDIAEQFKRNHHFQKYIQSQTMEEFRAYNLISVIQTPSLYHVVITLATHMSNMNFCHKNHSHLLTLLDMLEAQEISDHDISQIQSHFKDRYVIDWNNYDPRYAYRLAPYLCNAFRYDTRTAALSFLNADIQKTVEYVYPQGWCLLAQHGGISTTIAELLKLACQKHPSLYHHEKIIFQYPHLNFPYFEQLFIQSYNEESDIIRKNVLLSAHQKNLENSFKSTGISKQFLLLSLKNKKIAHWLSSFAKQEGLITYNRKSQYKRWLTFCEQQLNLPENQLIEQWNILQKIMPDEWFFDLNTHNKNNEISLII